jgi:mannose-6-phosphate isomerase-like protein (cupin superfamily)
MERTDKPWGGFVTFAKNEKVTVKILKIVGGEETSLQSHKSRDEDWYVLKGRVRVQYGHSPKDKLNTVVLNKGGVITVARGMLHRCTALDDTLILEISRGQFDENDIVRYEDKYGRVPSKPKVFRL